MNKHHSVSVQHGESFIITEDQKPAFFHPLDVHPRCATCDLPVRQGDTHCRAHEAIAPVSVSKAS
jgi:hypothetical protein